VIAFKRVRIAVFDLMGRHAVMSGEFHLAVFTVEQCFEFLGVALLDVYLLRVRCKKRFFAE